MSNRLPAKPPDVDTASRHVPGLVARDYAAFGALPQGYDALFAAAAATDPCLTRGWFEAAEGLLGPTEHLLMIGAERAGSLENPAALVIGRTCDNDSLAYGGRSYTSLDSVYSLLYAPLLDPQLAAATALAPICARICGAGGTERQPYDLVRLQPLDPATPAFEALRQGLQEAGFAVQSYRQFGNRFEPCDGLDVTTYMAHRPSRLRSTIRRGERSLVRRGRVEFLLEKGGLGRGITLETALSQYRAIYEKSWKAAEPRADFIEAFARRLASTGALRLGLLLLDGVAVAAQIWALWHGRAILYKLAHDRCLDRHSPGSVLTAQMIAHLLECEAVHELDFGPGDDSYKADWVTRRRERWGLIAFNPRTLRGRMGICRHIWGRGLKRALGFR